MENKSYFGSIIDFSDTTELEKCLKHFCNKDSAVLNFQNFKDLMFNVLTDSEGKPCEVPEVMLTELFAVFDRNCDHVIDVKEFDTVWNKFIKPLVHPVTALLIIDVQNDFVEGSLALKNCPAKQDGKEVIPVINNLLEKFKFDAVVYSIDYHPTDHISFIDNVKLHKVSEKNKNAGKIAVFDIVHFAGPPEMEQKLWPTHCVQNTWGCELHPDLNQLDDSLFVYKGTNSHIDSYSAFFDNMKASSTVLHEELKKRSVTHVLVCGVALDYCVAFTALDAAELGYATSIIQDATRGTDNDGIKAVTEEFVSFHCVLTDSAEVENILSGKDRKLEFASIFLNSIKKV